MTRSLRRFLVFALTVTLGWAFVFVATAHAQQAAATLALPSFLMSWLISILAPFLSSYISVWLHNEFTKAESWYASLNAAAQTAIGVVFALVIGAFGSKLTGLPGGADVTAACAGGTTLSAACLTALLGLTAQPAVQAAITVILTATGILSSKAGRIHAAIKEVAAAQHIELSQLAR